MGLCLFGKCQDCQNNCKGWFAGDPVLIDGCKKRCAATKGSSPSSRDDYMNQIGAGSQQQAQIQEAAEKSDASLNERIKTIGKIGAFVLLVFVFIYLIRRTRK